jgi:thiamine-phosphate pyrophosphorylase
MLDRAQRLAARHGRAQGTLVDLLAAFIDEIDPETSHILDSPTHGWTALRSDLPTALPSSDDDLLASPPHQWSADAAKAIARAQEIAIAFSRFEPIQTTDVLIGLMELGHDLNDLFVQHGIESERLISRFHASRQPPLIELPADLDWKSAGHPDRTDLFQILDANINRVREGLRVFEEFARFIQANSLLLPQIKAARHQLTEIERCLPLSSLLASRDTQSDVGTSHTSSSEMSRDTAADVARASMKRAQEGLRSIEEFGKIVEPKVSELAKELRYRIYQLERLIHLEVRSREELAGIQLYWLCDPHALKHDLEWTVRQAIVGGVDAIQLRDKKSSDRQCLQIAQKLRQWTRESRALFIMNDRPDLARLAFADGVHVGQDELTVRDARRILGPEGIVGVSTHSIEQARSATLDGANYLGVGPIFPSKTKSFDRHVGIELVREVGTEITLPWFAIGGIDLSNVRQVAKAGATRIAVSSGIGESDDPKSTAAQLRQILDERGA